MQKIHIGMIGYGTVGQGVQKILKTKQKFFKEKFQTDFILKSVCDLCFSKNKPKGLKGTILTTSAAKILEDPDIHVVIELIGGVHPAKEFILQALKNKKHVITANKSVIAQHGKLLFAQAKKHSKNIYFESSVMAGVPVIKTITEGIAGNNFNSIYGIINGTCNYILTEMNEKNYTFAEAVRSAQRCGYAESDPTLDINGMDSTHKLAILIALTMSKHVNVKDIYTEGITHIAHEDIENAESLGLAIKLLAIAKRHPAQIEARVHPTLISKGHPLASINGVGNAIYMNADHLGELLLSGNGAGQMAAASGVISDLINLSTHTKSDTKEVLGNTIIESDGLSMKSIDEISTKFYIRFMAIDKPGVLSKISGILGNHGISINSVNQKAHCKASAVPLIMLTDYAKEKKVRQALEQIHKLSIVKSKPIAIRMENLS